MVILEIVKKDFQRVEKKAISISYESLIEFR